MRDWETLVEQRLAGLVLEPEERTEVIAEAAAHLEDICEEMLRQGVTEEVAVRLALSQAGDWRDLQRKICAAKRREQPMKKRVWQLWIPGFLTLILSTFFLMTLQQYGYNLASSGADRTRFFCICRGCSRFLSSGLWEPTSRPGRAVRGEPCFLSAFFLITLTGAFLFMFPFGLTIQLIMGRPIDFSRVATVLLKDGISWIFVPGAALLGGGLLAHLLLSARSSSRDTAIG